MSKPKVSILMSVRDELEHLPAALKSLQHQTFKNWELVAVDDGSTDGTLEFLIQKGLEDCRVKVISQPPTGLVRALNMGLENCNADFIARMDGDDICHPQRLEKQLAAFTLDQDLDLVSSRVRHFPRPALQGGMLAYEAWQNSQLDHSSIMRDLFVESPFAHPSVMFRRQRVVAIGAYRDQPWAEDYDLWLRLAADGARFSRIPEVLLYWRDRPNRLTRTAENCSLSAFRACKAHFLKRSILQSHKQVILWGAGSEGKAWRKALAIEGIRVSAWIEIDQKKIGQTIHGAPVIAPGQVPAHKDMILVTVGAKGARKQIREWCCQTGLTEVKDFICVT